MSAPMHPADRDELETVWPVVAEARLFADRSSFTGWWEEGPWRVQVSDKATAVVGRWREHLPYLAILGLWCSPKEIAGVMAQMRTLAAERGLARVLGPLIPEEDARPYRDAGFEVAERIVMCRRAVPSWGGSTTSWDRRSATTVRVRPAGSDELPEVLALDSACFSDFWRYDLPTLGALAGVGELAVAESGGALIGYTLWVPSGAEASIARLAVDPAWTRRGVGRALLRAAMARMADAGSRGVTLTTQEANQASRGLYRSEGFRESPGRLVYTISSPCGEAGRGSGEE